MKILLQQQNKNYFKKISSAFQESIIWINFSSSENDNII